MKTTLTPPPTPEPWSVSKHTEFVCSGDTKICQFFDEYEYDFENSKANASRIVQCVNACAGIQHPVEVIRMMKSVRVGPDGSPDFSKVISEMEHLQSENARLREALREITKLNPLKGSDIGRALDVAHTALKGGNHESM